MVLKNAQVKELLQNPSKAAEVADLIYITEDKLTIKRHRHGKGFFYTEKEKKIQDKKDIERLRSLIIPPAWNDVFISPIKNGHLQVVGKDEKHRKQYKYHPHWNKIRNETKFFKMASFGNILPEIRKQVAKDLQLPKMTKRKCLALVISLMEETHIRIGNESYAKSNKSYGLSTLRTKHIDLEQNKLVFNFVGKKGKKHSVMLSNKKLQKLVMQCKEIPGWELFQYYDEEGNHHSIDSGMVNEYIHQISGDLFSAKDFRTWSASNIFMETLSCFEKPNSEAELKKNILAAHDAAAKGLGNTRTVCKKYYVHPAIIEKYEKGELAKYCNVTAKKNKEHEWLSNSEVAMLGIISGYKIEL